MGIDRGAGSAAGKGKMPHVGKPLPGGQPIKPQPWWAGIGQSFTGAKESWTKQWAVQQRSWKKHKKFQMPGTKNLSERMQINTCQTAVRGFGSLPSTPVAAAISALSETRLNLASVTES